MRSSLALIAILALAGCPKPTVTRPTVESPAAVQVDPKQVLAAKRAKVLEVHGGFDVLPKGAKVLGTPYTLRGRLPVYALSPEHEAFVDAYDFVKDPPPQTTLEVLQVLFRHRQFHEARPRAMLFVELNPSVPEAAEVAALLLDSFVQQGDAAWAMATLDRMRELWTNDDAQLDRAQAGMERLAWAHCLHLREENLLEEAGNSWVDFGDLYARSEHAPEAWLNAAQAFEAIELSDDAALALDEFLKRYPDDPRVAEALATRDRLKK